MLVSMSFHILMQLRSTVLEMEKRFRTKENIHD